MKRILVKIKNKKIFLSFIFLLLFIFFPFSANAFSIFDFFGKLIGSISLGGITQLAVNVIIAIAFFVPYIIGRFFLALSIAFLGGVFAFMYNLKYSYSGTDNPLIKAGLPVTQGLAGIIIIFGFLVIGLATILGIEEYRAQRKFPVLIICAILIFFANVLCGFVIDTANIIMFNFLENNQFMNLKNVLEGNFLAIFGKFNDFGTLVSSLTDSSFLVKLITIIIYCFLAGLIIFILGLVFLVRVIALPVFVVLSPLAIASYVAPQIPKMPQSMFGHRQFFDWWLEQFLQWCFLGVTVAFFLYLSSVLLAQKDIFQEIPFSGGQPTSPISSERTEGESDEGNNYLLPFLPHFNEEKVFAGKLEIKKFPADVSYLALSEDGKLTESQLSPKDYDQKILAQNTQPQASDTKDEIPFFKAIAPYFGALFILYMALQLGFTTAAFGAAGVVAFGNRVGAAVRGEVGKRIGAGMRRLRTAAGERMAKSERLQKFGEKIKAGYQKIPAPVRTGLEYGIGRPIYAVRKGIGMATSFEYAGVLEESKKRFAEAKEKFKKEGADAKKLAQTILNPFMTLEDKAAAWAFAKETGQFGKVIGALKGQGKNTEELLVDQIKKIAPFNPDVAKSLVRINPHLAEEIKQGLSKKTAEAIGLKDLTPEEEEAKITLPMKILMQLTPEEFVSVNPEAQKHSEFQTYLSSPRVSVSQFRKFLEQGDPEAVADFKKIVKEKLGGWNYFEGANKPVWNWIKHSPAVHDLGILREEETGTKKLITEPTEEAFEEAREGAKRRGERFG